MKFTFDNGYTVSIIDESKYIPLPEVGIIAPDSEEMEIQTFISADKLTEILTEIKER